MKIHWILLIGILLVATSHKTASRPAEEIVSLVEINVLDYTFMKEIANFILTTDTDNLFPQYEKPSFYAEYNIEIKNSGEDEYGEMENRMFSENGTYSIRVSLSLCLEPHFFKVNGINFHTFENLVPYFDSCNVKKINKKVNINEDSFWYYFWFFEVKDGKVIEAIYFYEPVDNGFCFCDVYDLIHKKYYPYYVWKPSIVD